MDYVQNPSPAYVTAQTGRVLATRISGPGYGLVVRCPYAIQDVVTPIPGVVKGGTKVMPRNYIRKTNKNSWTQENMRNAINAILKENKSIRKVGREYGIPESTIRKRINQKQTQPGNLGRNAVFSQEQEAELVEYIINMSQTYFGITQMQLRKIAFDFAELKK
ncbi:hypothetical protein ABEB36_011006 [Hypothenemus hampei]|uniref:HTH psq-type domain-containing protein n=1 Tax=Hypothenemus hampei TaxID=57062 RepID=A0ABD1EDX0_HYPHA